ncbi:eukaryotic translation initiation factor 2-alpha kinase 3-like [Scylla paramamosain]|uniref:eukaryotic translation initiation factor 2-alpha kinase 3-like n=1 Tax=Scylla paramamosain TaxID=85552 RepID=UPI00308307A0
MKGERPRTLSLSTTTADKLRDGVQKAVMKPQSVPRTFLYIQPSNIIISLEGKVKVGDFSLVTTIAEEEEQQAAYTPATHLQRFPAEHTHTHRGGIRLHMSPEQVSGQVYDYKVDVYSLGLVFFEMLVPFGTGMERLAVMTRLKEELLFPPKFEDNFPDEQLVLTFLCLDA